MFRATAWLYNTTPWDIPDAQRVVSAPTADDLIVPLPSDGWNHDSHETWSFDDAARFLAGVVIAGPQR